MTSSITRENNSGLHIEKIVSILGCVRHGAEEGVPCWTIESIHGPLKAICNDRAWKSGARGDITPYNKLKKDNR